MACTPSASDLWCGVVTVELYSLSGVDLAHGFVDATDTGALSVKTFSVGTNSYTIDLVFVGVGTNAGVLYLSLTSALTAADRAKLVLQVDGSSGTFAFSDASDPTSAYTYEWTMSGLDWSSETSVTLRLRATNSAPEFSGVLEYLEVAENSPPDTVVGTVTATDADDDTLTYSLEGTDAGSFAIDSGTGEIKTVSGVTYNYETKFTYQMTAKAEDGNGGSDTINVNITLLDDDTEKSAKPAKPTLAAVPGSSTSLTATWEKPGLNGGPDITGYKLEYREGSGNWQNFAHSGTALTTTLTGLTANTEYQVRVRAENGETDSDWSDPSDAVRTNAEAGPPTVTLYLSDDEPFEDLLAVTVTATVSPATPVAFTVEISASPVAPATGDDFELSTNRTLTFAENATGSTGTVRISPVSDEDPEPNDVVTVSGVVSNPAIPNPDDVRLTILNDDADLAQDIAIDAPAAVDEGAGTANVTVTLTTLQNTAPVIDAQLFYRQRPETATRGGDYTRPQSLGNRIAIVPVSEFSANADGTAWVARHSFEIGIVDDSESEPDETIVFEIYSISDNRGIEQTIVIRDDDRSPAVSIAAANPTVLEGQQPAVFTLSRTGAPGSALTVTVALTEQANRDVLPDGAATERTVTFAPGSSTAALTVELKDDELVEPDRDLTAAVRAGAGYTVGDPSSATVTVEDDEAPTAPEIDDIEVVSTPRLRWRNSREEDTYGEGENIRIGVRFDQPVHVEGYPVLALEVGDPCISVCEARYESGSGTDTLVFAYLVLDTEIDRNGVAIPANPVRASIDDLDGFQHPQRLGPGGAPFLQEEGHAERPQGGRVAARRRRTCRWRMPRRTRPTARWISRCAWSRTAWAS